MTLHVFEIKGLHQLIWRQLPQFGCKRAEPSNKTYLAAPMPTLFTEVPMLKTGPFLAVLSVAILAADSGSNQTSEAEAVVNRAIKVMGGTEKLVKLPATTFSFKGSLESDEKRAEIAGEGTIMLPDKYRSSFKITAEGSAHPFSLIIDGDLGWHKDEGDAGFVQDGVDSLKVVRNELEVPLMINSLIQLKSKGVELTKLDDVKIDKRAAFGVKVKRKDRPDCDIFFDKETDLPIKAEIRVHELPDGEEALFTFLFGGYKEADGVKYPTKLTVLRANKRRLVLEISEVRRLNKLDPKLFEKPD
jgi:hypothetical protein